MKMRRILLAALGLLLVAADCLAQEPTYMDAATHPGKGQLYLRTLLATSEYESNGYKTDELSAEVKLAYGISSDFAILTEFEFADLSTAGDKDSSGIYASTLKAKYRLFKNDFSPLNTWMASVFAGVTVPGEVGTMDGLDPYPSFAIATTTILNRHGLNGELEWEGRDADPDTYSVNASYLYRLAPPAYTINTRGAWYLMFESINQFNDQNESRHDIATGILYEARKWAWEASIRIPVEENWQPREDYQLTVGFRFLP